jgi:hypothetical protein
MADREYDDRNRGIFWEPYPEQKLVGAGKLDVDGKERKIAIIREPLTANGEPKLVIYAKVAVLWPTDPAKMGEKSPAFSGPLDIGQSLRVAGWPGEKNDRRFVQLKVEEDRRAKKAADETDKTRGSRFADDGHDVLDDSIPF